MRNALGGTDPVRPGIRQIPLDYPLFPRKRPLELTAGGMKLASVFREAVQPGLALLEQAEAYAADLKTIARRSPADGQQPCWENGWIPPLDAVSIYTLIRSRKPATYLEIGSGTSTKFARRAIRDGGLSTRIVSIDPAPRAEIDALCDEVVRSNFEDADLRQAASRLTSNDVLFIDNSHRSFQSSDVTVFFTEFMPAIPPGVVWGLHDILLPFDYPEDWLFRFYNEQYLLAAYLLGGHRDDSILLPVAYALLLPELALQIDRVFESAALTGLTRGGGCFWLQRKSDGSSA